MRKILRKRPAHHEKKHRLIFKVGFSTTSKLFQIQTRIQIPMDTKYLNLNSHGYKI